ncbi:MAG: cysteine--tRNA ligase [Phycisphaerae bacterium]
MTLRENNLHIYNTLSRAREKFEPINPPHVGMYVCGPTVYGDTHLGHAKSYISFDVIVRYLRYLGYKVRYVQNITDVGHLTDDADEGEDKVEREAKAAKVHPMQIAERFTRRYFEDMDRLNVLRPDISPRASGHIIEQIEHTKRLIETGHAYEANGSVYFDVASWPAYGKLSGRSVEAMRAGARVEANPDKKHPADFALWKRAEPGHIMQWPSPWGMGYPGWHIECTVMSQKYLGETFDIHGGGIENQFPHHEDEIAQAEAATPGAPGFAKYWLHNNMVTVAGKKMGKSLGNFITLKDAFAKWNPMVLRLFILQSHYRSPLDFSDEALEAAQEGYRRLAGTAAAVSKALLAAPAGKADATVAKITDDARRRFGEAMDDDFGTAGAVAVLFDLAGGINTTISPGHATRGTLDCLKSTFEDLSEGILGLKLKVSVPHPLESYSAGEGGQALEWMFIRLVELIKDLRKDARKAKNFAQADAIRERVEEIGIALEDSPTGSTWRFTFKRQKPERRV